MNHLLLGFSIGAKLWLAPGLTLLLMLLVAGGGFFAMGRQQHAVVDLVHVSNPNLFAFIELEEQIREIHADSYQLIAWSSANYPADKTEQLSQKIAATLPKVLTAAQTQGQRPGLSAGQVAQAQTLTESVKKFTNAIGPVLDLARSDPSVGAMMMIASDDPFAEVAGQIASLRKGQMEVMNTVANDTTTLFLQAKGLGVALVFGCLLLAGFATWWVRRSILQPVNSIRDAASRLKEGDLSEQPRVSGNDEISMTALAMADTMTTLRDTITSVNTAAAEIDAALGEIAAGNQDLSVRTERQASHLQKTSADTSRLADAVETNARGAHAAADLAALSKGRAERGGKLVNQMVGVMQAITESSKKVHDITGVIDSIAFQTNILALNAAVEAARAGEQGRGFAVVASEVRVLAQRSAAAAAEINSLITASSERVEAGGVIVLDTGKAIEQVVTDVQMLFGLINSIASASDEQNTDVQAIASMLAELDGVTHQNAALVEQAAAATSSIRQESARLVSAVGVFRTR
jgi:methyl-accepting chemotaxis protein